MNILADETPSIASVAFASEHLNVVLSDGRTVSTPLFWYPRLQSANRAAREYFEISPLGVHWPELDEDLSLAGMLRGAPDETKRSGDFNVRGRKRLPDELTSLLVPFANQAELDLREVRLQRQSVILNVLARAKAKINLDEHQLRPVPNKFLVPFLERASVEDASDEYMLNAWASLLVNSARSETVQPRFVSILSELTGSQARLLEGLVTQKRERRSTFLGKKYRDFDGLVHEQVDFQEFFSDSIKSSTPMDKLFHSTIELLTTRGIMIETIGLRSRNVRVRHRNFSATENERLDLDLLSSLELIQRREISKTTRKYSFIVRFSEITLLGLHFLSVCSANARTIIEEISADTDRRRSGFLSTKRDA